jgi:hypothetical protein
MEPFALKRTGDDDYPSHIKALVIGLPKSGKTTLLSTFPSPLVGDVEFASGGLQSIAHLDIPHVTVDHSSKLDSMLTILRDDSLRKKAAVSLGLTDIETVAIDTLDSLQKLLQKERMKDERRQFFEMKDWGWLLEQFQEVVRNFTALPMHVVFTVHTKMMQDDEGRIVTVPGLQGAIQDQIAGMVGYSLKSERRTEIDQATGQKRSVYSLLTEGDEYNPHLGNRAAGRLPRVIEPSFKVLHDAIYANVQIAKSQRIEVQAPEPTPEVTQGETVAPSSGQVAPEATPEPVAPTGAPRDDSPDPINGPALQHLTKMAAEFGVDLNPVVKDWSLGQARDVARYVVACKTDAANGDSDQDELRSTVIEGLIGMGAISATASGDAVPTGTIDEVVKWAEGSQEHAQIALEHEQGKGDDARSSLVTKLQKLAAKPTKESGQASEPAPQAEPTPEPQVTPEVTVDDLGPEAQKDDDSSQDDAPDEETIERIFEEHPEPPTADEAEALIKAELGGEAIKPPEEQRPCETCGKSKESDPEDFDVDIARLSEIRFKQWLCIADYMAALKPA